ncbi:MAG: hypothetical protein KatS3mg087_0566 [Patescibacteria group bacterium]|nr:MAG: hypothetical protein KatS3mg087_0566 [Patescibacteria group bacterium]
MTTIWLNDRGVGKGRPRFSRNGVVHTCDRYGKWKQNAIAQIKKQCIQKIATPCFVECLFVNFASSDSDNLQGSVLDALVQSGVLENDSSSYVVGCSGKFVKARKKRGQDKVQGILIRITPASIEYIDFDAELVSAIAS